MGRSVAIQLSQKGANIIIASRSLDKLSAALESVKVPITSPKLQGG